MFEIIFLIILSGYFMQSVFFSIGASKKFKKLSDDKLPAATVIVAARNEEKNIIRCLESLNNLQYPDGKLEIYVVDDKSTDATGKLIDDFIVDKPIFKKIDVENEIGKLRGKTNAIATAIEIAKGEIIITTDADCAVHPLWANTLASYYTKDVAMVNGYTTQKTTGGFSGMQALDFIYLLIVAAGTMNFKKPLSCIGNNMSYRKSVYQEVGGYEGIPFSVTEDFGLLMVFDKLKKYKIIYPLDKDALVVSEPCENMKALYHQKKRWGVGGLDSRPRGYFVMMWGFLSNILVLLTPVMFSPVWLYLVFFKLSTDFFVLYSVHQKLELTKDMKYFWSFQIYFTLYVIILPLILLFTGKKVNWKGRKY
ncbi:MAG: glycosyltransferase [Ignavibacteriaceae bacterium]|nr:glycosyltransferase [Ignavibacteriaceae bacterium]